MENISQTSSNKLFNQSKLSSNENKSSKFYNSFHKAETDKEDSFNKNEIFVEKNKKLLNLNNESDNMENFRFYEIDKLFKFYNENDKYEYPFNLEILIISTHQNEGDSFSISNDESIKKLNNETILKYIKYFKIMSSIKHKNLLLNSYFRFTLTEKEEQYKNNNTKKSTSFQ